MPPDRSRFETLHRTVASLTPAELEALYRHVVALRALDGSRVASVVKGEGASPQAERTERTLYEALAERFAAALHTPRVTPPWGAFQKQRRRWALWHSAAEKALAAHAYWFQTPTLSVAEEISILRMYAELVIAAVLEQSSAFSEKHTVVGWTHVCWTLERLPQLMEAAFPGYAEAGLLKAVVRVRTASRT